MKSHRLFMMHEEVQEEINRLFTGPMKKALEVFLKEDPKTTYLGETVRNYDL